MILKTWLIKSALAGLFRHWHVLSQSYLHFRNKITYTSHWYLNGCTPTPILSFVLCFLSRGTDRWVVRFRGQNTRLHAQQTWSLALALSLTSSGTPGKSLALSGSFLIYKTGWPGKMIGGQFYSENRGPKEVKAGEKVEKWYSFRKRILVFGVEGQAAQKSQGSSPTLSIAPDIPWWERHFQQQSLYINFRSDFKRDFRGLLVNTLDFMDDVIEVQSSNNKCKVTEWPHASFSLFSVTETHTHLWQLQWNAHWRNLPATLSISGVYSV